jgi:hypothetical protein
MTALALAVVCLASLSPARAQAAATIVVRVRLASGEPIPGVRVSVAETGDNRASALATTRADGKVAVVVPHGTYAVTVFATAAGSAPTDLVDRVVYGIPVAGDREVDVALERGTVVQAAFVDEAGRPVSKGRVEVSSNLHEPTAVAFTDENGWARMVMLPGMSIYVAPPTTLPRAIGRWVRFEDLVLDERGIAEPIVLYTLPEPRDLGDGRYLLHGGEAPGPHVTVALIAEGFTDADEPFVDANGNGACDDEPYLDTNGSGAYDNGEPFVDANDNGRRDMEPFDDVNGDGVCNRGERALFLESAVDHLRSMLAFPVYRELRERLDVYALFVASAQAGSDFPTLPRSVARDTAFDSKFLSLNFVFDCDRDLAIAEARRLLPEHDYLAILVNNVYGVGRESGGGVVILYGGRVPSPAYVAAHEFGHTIGGLADEYFAYDGAPPYTREEPNYPNVTRSSEVGNLKWARFVRPGTAVPTVDGTPGIGAFEGGYYRRHGISRPSFNCLMRRSSIFCAVCADHFITRFDIRRGVAPPTTARLALPLDGATTATYVPVAVDVPDLAAVASVRAIVDGVPTGAAATVSPFGLQLDARALAVGSHRVAAEVRTHDGAVSRTGEAIVVVGRLPRSEPSLASARFKGGTLVLEGLDGAAMPGAVLFVDSDRFSLETARDGSVRVVKRSVGSASGLRISKAIRKNRPVTLSVINPDGGRSPEIVFTR